MLPWIHHVKKVFRIFHVIHTIHATKKTAKVFTVGVVFVFLMLGLFTFVSPVQTQADDPPTEATADTLGIDPIDQNIALASTDIRIIIVKIIRAILGLLAIITVILIIYAGFLIMTSGGDPEKVGRGRKVMINAVVGLVIILSSLAIVQFIINALSSQYSDGLSGKNPAMETFSGSGSLGKIIKDHYPFRNEVDIPRNTSIIVTFAMPVEPSSFIENTNKTCWGPDKTPISCDKDNDKPYFGDCFDSEKDGISFSKDCDQLKTDIVTIDTSDNFEFIPEDGADPLTLGVPAAVMVNYEGQSQDVFTAVFKPLEYIGSPEEVMWYTVQLTENIFKKNSKESIFSGQWDSFYEWEFRASTGLDLDPPYVTDVYPKVDSQVKRNSIVQVNFNEAIDPTTVTGHLSDDGFFNNVLTNSLGKVIPGTWQIANGYKTISYLSDEPCGLNSCGEQMYCLPTACPVDDESCTSPYDMIIRTAAYTGNEEVPFEAIPFTGVYDAAFNALDNLSDGSDKLTKPSGHEGVVINAEENIPDNYFWNFTVQNTIDRRSPAIASVIPGIDSEDVDGEADLSIAFNMLMWILTLDDIALVEYPEHVCADAATIEDPTQINICSENEKLSDIWYKTFSKTEGEKVISHIKHRTFGPNNLDLYYYPSIPHTVKSVTQNCMYPGRGPWSKTKAKTADVSTCKVTYNSDGKAQPSGDCVAVTPEANSDTGCVYTYGQGIATNDDPNFLQPTISVCISELEKNSDSDFE